jgi:hypothetical protein
MEASGSASPSGLPTTYPGQGRLHALRGLEAIEIDSYLLIGELFACLSRTKTTGSLQTMSLVLNYPVEINAISW